MADSKFLRWQDMDSDGLIDICDDLIVQKPLPCPSKCIPNPVAFVPNWKNEPTLTPWLNEKTCYYEVSVVTEYTTTIDESLLSARADGKITEAEAREALNERAMEFLDDAIESYLLHYDKQDNLTNRDAIKSNIQFHKYFLGPRAKNRLQLLFRVPFEVIENLEPASDERPLDNVNDEPGWQSIEYTSSDFSTKLITVRRGLNMFSRYLKVYRAIDGGNVKFLEDDRLFNLEDYGDPCLFTPNGSVLARMQNELEKYLNDLGYQIPGIGDSSSFGATLSSPFMALTRENVTRIRFDTKNYELKQIVLWTDGCGEKPFYFNSKLKPLLRSESWKDRTGVAYMCQLYKMDAALTARKPKEWKDFVVQFTYPQVYATTNPGGLSPWNETASCVADALAAEAKELGQDILDEVLNIGDVIAYQFRKGLCTYNMEELREMELDMGIADTVNDKTKKKHSMMSMAKMQAFKELAESDQVFAALCAKILGDALGWKNVTEQMDDMYEYGLERIKVCGLFDLGLDAIKCLLGGLTLEQALSSMLKAALQAMNIENFGDLFIGLPPEKQAELDALVKKNFEEGNLFRPDSEMQQYSDNLATPGTEFRAGSIEDTPLLGKTQARKLSKPWEDPEVIARDHRNRSKMSAWAESSGARRSLADQIATGRATDNNLNPDLVMDLYIQGLLEVYSENMLELLDELNKFPGAQLISMMIALFDCPMPPLFNPSVADFMKSIGLPFCNDLREIRLPRMWDPSEWYPDFVDFMGWLWKQFKIAIKQAAFNILVLILVKICQILGDAICKALEAVGDIAASLPSLLTGREQIRDIIRDTICGDEATDEQIDATMIDLMAKLGPGAAALANEQKTLQFFEDLSSTVTRRELAEAFLGRPPPDLLTVSLQLVNFEYPEFEDGLGSREKMSSVFRNIGNLMPAQAKQDLKDFLNELPEDDFFPANPTLCLSPKKQDDFADLRCELMKGRATEEDCDNMFKDMIEDMRDSVADMTRMMTGPPGSGPDGASGSPGGDFADFVYQNMPKLISEPGCDDGLLPDMLEPTRNVASATLGNDFEMLKIDYSKDMLGNGGLFASDSDWGLMNMALSDTMANPLTAHHRYARNRKKYVNFASNLKNGGEAATGFFSFLQGPAKFNDQRGQFPSYVGSWLMRQFLCAGGVTGDLEEGGYETHPIKMAGGWAKDLASGGSDVFDDMSSFSYDSNQTWQSEGTYKVSFSDLDFNKGWGLNVDLMQIPDFGYNTPISVDWDAQKIVITEKGRKNRPDMIMNYKDNAAGMREGCNRGSNDNSSNGSETNYTRNSSGDKQSEWSYGFEIHYFAGDLVDDLSFDSSGESSEPIATPLPSDKYDLTKEMDPAKKAEFEEEVRNSDPDPITNATDGVIRNRADDNVRIRIIEKINTAAEVGSPLAQNVADDMAKSDGFDLPPWIEGIPIIGWVLQTVINLFTKPFSSLVHAKVKAGSFGNSNTSVITNEKYEFVAVDNGLDGIDLTAFPRFMQCFIKKTEFSPHVTMLAEITGVEPSAAKSSLDTYMNTFFKAWAEEVGRNQNGWLYGAKYDYLLQEDADYVAARGSTYDTPGDTPVPYESIVVTETDADGVTTTRPPKNRDMIMGMSRDQYRNEVAGTPENTRVFYLNPGNFGGSYTDPPLHIKPLQYGGWMGLVQVMFPELSPCKPQRTDLVDFGEIQQKIDQRMAKIPEDPRLKHGPKCALEVPYNRILDRAGKTGMMGVIEAAIRIFASAHFLKSIATFSRIQPKFPENFSNIYSQYIVEVMEESFKEAQPPFWEMFSVFSDQEFWYAFLEQSVQFYAWRLDNGEIESPPSSVLNALRRLNDYQEKYNFPYNEDLKDAKKMGDAGKLQSLKGYRFDKNLEGVLETEEDAKLILAELVGEQLTHMGKRLVDNLRAQGYIPAVYDLDYWVFETQCVGSTIRMAGPEFIEAPAGLPTPDTEGWPGPFYTYGGEFCVAHDGDVENEFEVGDEYVGYYYAFEEPGVDGAIQGDIVYVIGDPTGGVPLPEGGSIADTADLLKPIASKLKIVSVEVRKSTDTVESARSGIGSFEETTGEGEDATTTTVSRTSAGGRRVENLISTDIDLGDVPTFGSADDSIDIPFTIEKFISIDGVKMDPDTAINRIKSNNPNSMRISEAYPGPIGNRMRQVKNQAGQVVGVQGDLGVKYGLVFYFNHEGSKIPVADVSVNALDLPISQIPPFEGNSKMLFCLLNLLKAHPRYRLMTSYIFPMKKITSMMAVYNDMGFLSAIGEVTVGKGDYDRWIPMGDTPFNFANAPDDQSAGDWINSSIPGVAAKPGSIAFIDMFISKAYNEPDPYWGAGGALRDGTETNRVRYKKILEGGSFVGGNEGWAHYDDRDPKWFQGIGVLEWDKWDRLILKNSVARIKKMFRAYYNSRDWQPGDIDRQPAGAMVIRNLRERMMPNPAMAMLPWWKRRKARTTPFDANGKLCEK